MLLFIAFGLSASAQSSFTINTFAGNHTSGYSGDGGPATSAQISNTLFGLATDASGNFYFGDYSNCRIRKVDLNGIITTIAGTGTCGSTGDGGPATSANIRWPLGLAVDSSGNVYFGEDGSPRVRRVSTSGTITTVAGTGVNSFSGDGGAATSATMGFPTGLAVDASGNLYISDLNNNRIRKVNGLGIISTFAGGGASLGDGGAATSGTLNGPWGLSLDSSGNLYIADTGGNRIRKVDTLGIITTVAGIGISGVTGDGGPATSARISSPWSVSVDTSGNIYLAEASGFRIRRVNTLGIMETVAGTGTSGYSGDGGPALSATLASANGIHAAANGRVYFADPSNAVIRVLGAGRITSLPSTTIGSTSAATTAYFGQVTGLGTTASLVYGSEFSVNTSGCVYSSTPNFQASCPVTFTPQKVGIRRDALKVTDTNGNVVGIQYLYGIGQGPLSAVTPGTISTVNLGSVGPVTPAEFTFDPAGNLYFNEYPGGRIIKIAANGTASTISTTGLGSAVPLNLAADWAGNLYMADSTGRLMQLAPDGTATVIASGLSLGSLVGQMAIASNGNFYICDISNNRIVRILADGSSSSVLSLTTTLSAPGALAFDAAGNLYISNQGNSTIVKVTPSGTSSVVTPSSSIQLPAGIWTDAAGNLYVVDAGANKLFRIAPNGTATVIAGTGTAGNSGDGGPATSAMITPTLTAVDADGVIFLADNTNHLLRKVSPSGSLAFADTLIGSSSSISPSIANIGNQSYTFPSAFSFTANPTPFSLTTGGSGDCSALLSGSFAAGASCNLSIQFTPATAATFNDTLTLAPGLQLQLAGLGVLPAIGVPTVSTTPLNFGNVTNGSTSASQAVTISNSGTGTLNITSAVISGTDAADFSVVNNCSATLAAGLQCTVSVTFHPSTAGTKTANLSITDADSVALTPQTQIITLNGTGVAPSGQASLNTSSLVFPSQETGTSAAAQTLTLTNTGAAALNITSVSLTGTNAGEFTLTNNCASSLAVSANCTVQVVFSPTSEGSKTANLVFTFSNGANPPTSTVALSGISTAAVARVPTGTIKIVSVRSGKALDVVGASALNGVPLQQYDFLSGANQVWEAIAVDSTYYKIRNVATRKVLDARNAGITNGTMVQQWNYLGLDNQKWQFVPQTDGSFEIVNKLSGKALDVLGVSMQNQARIQLWDYNATDNQKWQVTPVTVPTPAVQYYTISTMATGKVLDVLGASMTDQARVQQYDYVYGLNQQWQLVSTTGDYYKIVNRLSGKVLDSVNAGTTDGVAVQQYTYAGNDNQQWQLVPTANGYYQIVNKLSGKSLDITAMSTANGATVQTYTYWGGPNQQFEVIPVMVP